MFCSYCGKETTENAAFCPYCGKQVVSRSNSANGGEKKVHLNNSDSIVDKAEGTIYYSR